MRNLFAAMSATLLNTLGEPAIFGPSLVATKINIQYGVQTVGLNGDHDYGAEHDIATVDGALNPKIGDTFRVLADDGSTRAVYRLERRARNNGVNQQFVVLRTA